MSVRSVMIEAVNHEIGSFNDAKTRAIIASQIELGLQQEQVYNHLFHFRVTCDESNNPPELIDKYGIQADVILKDYLGHYSLYCYVIIENGRHFYKNGKAF